MRDADLYEFTLLLDSTSGMLSRGQYTPSEGSTAMFFRVLQDFTMDEVRAAFDTYVERKYSVPTPFDILEILRNSDGRPGAEEAWAIALTAKDEATTVVWTPEIAEAWGVARVVEQNGDEVGARMAFKEAYTRIVAAARQARVPMRWQATLGHDPAEREAALRRAAELGRLPPVDPDVLALPAPRGTATLLDAPALAAAAPPDVLARLVAARERLTAAGDYVPGPGFVAIARTAELREASERRTRAYRGGR